MVDKRGLLPITHLLSCLGSQSSPIICTRGIPEEEIAEEGGQDLGVNSILGRVGENLSEKCCKIVKDMLVCGGKVADKLLALQVVAAALQAPMKEIGRDDWFPKGLEEDEESLCCTVDRHRRRLLG